MSDFCPSHITALWLSRPDDSSSPSKKDDLILRFQSTKHRLSVTLIQFLESKGANEEEGMSSHPQESVAMKELSGKHEEEKHALDHNRSMKMKQLFL